MEHCLNELSALLRNFPVELLRNAITSLREEQGYEDKPKAEIVLVYARECRALGIDVFLKRLDNEETMKLVADVAHVSPDELSTYLKDNNFDEFLKKLPLELLHRLSLFMGLLPSTKSEMVQQLGDETLLVGVEAMLHKLPIPLLKNFCGILNVPQNKQRRVLVEKILMSMFDLRSLEEVAAERAELEKARKAHGGAQKALGAKRKQAAEEMAREASTRKRKKNAATKAAAKKVEEEKEEPVIELDPPNLEFITNTNPKMCYTYLYDVFNFTHLKDWCKQNGISSSGKKSIVIKRILKHLDSMPKPDITNDADDVEEAEENDKDQTQDDDDNDEDSNVDENQTSDMDTSNQDEK